MGCVGRKDMMSTRKGNSEGKGKEKREVEGREREGKEGVIDVK